MRYLKKFNEMLNRKYPEDDKKINESASYSAEEAELLSDLKNDSRWVKSKDIPDHWGFEYRYDIGNGIDISILDLKINNRFSYYIKDQEDRRYYIDSVFNGYNRSYLGGSTLNRIINTCKDSLPYFSERNLLPTNDELSNIIFIEFREDFGFKIGEGIDWGFVSYNFPKRDPGTIIFQDPIGGEPYFPKDHNSASNPKLILRYEIDNKSKTYSDENQNVNTESITEEFNACKARIAEFGYKVKSKLYFTGTRYHHGDWRPERFIIVIEKQ